MTRVAIISTSILLLALTARGQIMNTNLIVCTIDLHYVEACANDRSNCNPFSIYRQTFQDSVKLIFPVVGSQSDVNLFFIDSAFIKWFAQNPERLPKAIRFDEKSLGQGKLTLDLTGLPDGNYLVWMMSCNLAASFQVTISTAIDNKDRIDNNSRLAKQPETTD